MSTDILTCALKSAQDYVHFTVKYIQLILKIKQKDNMREII